MTQRFEKAYNALYNAFMNDTLAKGHCSACAVGNIIADAMGGKVYKDYKSFMCTTGNAFWKSIFCTTDGRQSINRYPVQEKKIQELTGYSWKEMAKIEYVFETTTKIIYLGYPDHSEKEIMEDQFNGLMAVMDVLIELDEVKEGESYKNNFKNKFVSIN